MRAGTKLVAFGAVLAGALALGAVVGAVAGPIDVADVPSGVHSDEGMSDEGMSGATSVPGPLPVGAHDSVPGHDVTSDQLGGERD